MGLWISIAITLAVLGSVMWIMPSPREKAVIEMRNTAMQLGLRIRLLDKRMSDNLFRWLDDYRGFVLYEKSFKTGGALRQFAPKVLRINGRFPDDDIYEFQPLLEFLARDTVQQYLPALAESIVVFPTGVALLWWEKGGSKEVEEIDKILSECLQAVDGWQD